MGGHMRVAARLALGAAVAALLAGSVESVSFPGQGRQCGSPCTYCNTNQSPFTFYFNLSRINLGEDGTKADTVLNYDTPPTKSRPMGGHYEYIANPCDALQTTAVPGYTGTCSGDMAVCYCTTDDAGPDTDDHCESIADKGTLEWLVPSANVGIMNFTAGLCATNDTLWHTYVVFSCDNSDAGYGKGTVAEIHDDQWGLCGGEHSDYCTRCLEWNTQYTCDPFASTRESYVVDAAHVPQVVTQSTEVDVPSESVTFNFVTMDQFGNPYPAKPGDVQIDTGGLPLRAQVGLVAESTYLVTLSGDYQAGNRVDVDVDADADAQVGADSLHGGGAGGKVVGRGKVRVILNSQILKAPGLNITVVLYGEAPVPPLLPGLGAGWILLIIIAVLAVCGGGGWAVYLVCIRDAALGTAANQNTGLLSTDDDKDRRARAQRRRMTSSAGGAAAAGL